MRETITLHPNHTSPVRPVTRLLSHVSCHMSPVRVFCHTSDVPIARLLRDLSHVSCHTSSATRLLPHVFCHTSPVTRLLSQSHVSCETCHTSPVRASCQTSSVTRLLSQSHVSCEVSCERMLVMVSCVTSLHCTPVTIDKSQSLDE